MNKTSLSRQDDPRRGSLACVGLGMTLGSHLTPLARSHIEQADVVFAALSDGIVEMWLKRMHPDVRSLQPYYAEGKSRMKTYREWVDLMMTEQISDNPRRFRARVVLTNILVMAMDQTFKQDRDQKVVLAKTATLELTAEQSRIVIKAQAAGPLTLALRALGDDSKPGPVAANQTHDDDAPSGSGVTVIRFGVVPTGANGRKD